MQCRCQQEKERSGRVADCAKCHTRNSLVVQWLELCAFTAKGPGSLPGWGAKIAGEAQLSGKKKKKYRTIKHTHKITQEGGAIESDRGRTGRI